MHVLLRRHLRIEMAISTKPWSSGPLLSTLWLVCESSPIWQSKSDRPNCWLRMSVRARFWKGPTRGYAERGPSDRYAEGFDIHYEIVRKRMTFVIQSYGKPRARCKLYPCVFLALRMQNGFSGSHVLALLFSDCLHLEPTEGYKRMLTLSARILIVTHCLQPIPWEP